MYLHEKLRLGSKEENQVYSQMFFRRDPLIVKTARDRVGTVTQLWGLDDIHDDVCLLVSELMTNAVEHCVSYSVEVSLTHCKESLLIEVSDTSLVYPCVRSPGDEEEGGRGLLLVDSLSESWGVDLHFKGKTVWAHLKTKN